MGDHGRSLEDQGRSLEHLLERRVEIVGDRWRSWEIRGLPAGEESGTRRIEGASPLAIKADGDQDGNQG